MKLKKVIFYHYKAFENYTLHINEFNVLVGTNNAGKSTIIGAFKILREGIKSWRSSKPRIFREIDINSGYGHRISLKDYKISTRNTYYNLIEDPNTRIEFHFNNNSKIVIFFPEKDSIIISCEGNYVIDSIIKFKRHFDYKVGFVPVLGPLVESERIYTKETARISMFNYNSSRNFRNIWYHFPDKFEEFRKTINETWDNIQIEEKIENGFDEEDNQILQLYCEEGRITRELYWTGFGFQVWCQMLTFIIKNQDSNILLIDEPDIYLHSDLQRQLIQILKNQNYAVVIATHALEMINEAKKNDIVYINRNHKKSFRISDNIKLKELHETLGSRINPVLTEVMKTRKILFLEGKDFNILECLFRKFDVKFNRRKFTINIIEGFNPSKVQYMLQGLEYAIEDSVKSLTILDKDYRSEKEITNIIDEFRAETEKEIHILGCKEIENILLNIDAIHRLSEKKTGTKISIKKIEEIIDSYISENIERIKDDYFRKYYIYGNYTSSNYEKERREFIRYFEDEFKKDPIKFIPGKDSLKYIRKKLNNLFNISFSNEELINEFHTNEINGDMKILIKKFKGFIANS